MNLSSEVSFRISQSAEDRSSIYKVGRNPLASGHIIYILTQRFETDPSCFLSQCPRGVQKGGGKRNTPPI